MSYRIGVDIGGTFTDICLLEEETGETKILKVPSTPTDPSEAIDNGVRKIIEEHNTPVEAITYFGHGTTVGTNTTIEKKGSKTALITTKGFRDVLEIGRQTRPSLYDLHQDKPEVLIKRELRKEIDERIMYDGTIFKELNADNLEVILDELVEKNVESVAICFLHSYFYPEHEKKVKELIRKKYPHLYVSISNEVSPEFREFERFSTTVLNSYIGPVVSSYIGKVAEKIKNIGINPNPYINQSNGGAMSLSDTRKFPVRTCLSGPSAGIAGAISMAKLSGFKDLITFDMGGTSTDVSLIKDLNPSMDSDKQVAGLPVQIPMMDVNAVGAGGGSIAWVDKGGAVKVGPQSAGAVPGPASYGKGGDQPTVTDANVLLQRLNPNNILGGEMEIKPELAKKSIRNNLGDVLNMDSIEAASGIVKIVNSNMVRSIRVVSVEKGYDPRDFTLLAFGGAGPIHAADIAKELGMKNVLIPENPGILSAVGLLVSDLKMDFVKTGLLTVDKQNLSTIQKEVNSLINQAKNWFAEENIEEKKQNIECKLDARYEGQNYYLTITIGNIHNVDEISEKFHNIHKNRYGYENREKNIQIVNFRILAVGKINKKEVKKSTEKQTTKKVGQRKVLFEQYESFVDTDIYHRNLIFPEAQIHGPAIIEQIDSTIMVPPNVTAKMDNYRNIILNIEDEENE